MMECISRYTARWGATFFSALLQVNSSQLIVHFVGDGGGRREEGHRWTDDRRSLSGSTWRPTAAHPLDYGASFSLH